MPDINAPYPYFANPSKGVPLANGYIYIGLPDLDPTIPANQVTITARQEDGTNVPLVQPIRTNAGGLPTYNGGVVQLQNLVTVVYSIQVLDANMVPIYYQAQAYGIPSLGSGGTPTALTLLDGTAAMPSLAFLNNLDTGLFYVAPNELHVSIDGQDTAHFRTDVTDSELVLTSPQSASVEYFGNGEVNAFRTGVAGGFSLVMDDAGRDLLLGTSATERLRITDLGSITSGGLATATVQSGGLDLQQSGTGFIQGWRSSAVSTTIPGTGAPDEMYGWVQPVDVVGGFNVSGASGNLVGLVMTGYAGVVSTGVQTAPVMVDGRISGGGSIPVASNVFGVANNGTPVFAVLGDGSISPNPVNNIDDLLITGSLATGGAALNTAAAVNGGVTIGQTALADGYALVAQSADVAHGMTSFLPTNSYLGLGSAESDGGASVIGVGGTGTALDLTAYALTANTGATSQGVIRLTGWKKDGILAQSLASTETLFSLANGNSEVFTVLGDGTLTALGGASFGLTEIVTNLSESLIHRNPNTVQPFTTISTDPDVYGQVKSNVTVNGGYRVFGFAASNTAAYRVDAYTQTPASGFGLDSPIRFTGYKSNGGTGSATIADAENVFSVWNQSANCLLNITGNGNQTIAGSVVTGGGTVPAVADLGSLSVFTGTADGIAQYWLNDDVAHGITGIAPTNCYAFTGKVDSLAGGGKFAGLSEAETGTIIQGIATTPNTGLARGVVNFLATKKSGTTHTALAATETAFSFRNFATDVVGVMGNGDIYTAGRVVTGGETAPDSSSGGITILSPGSFAQTYKAPSVAHGMTSTVETDTYGFGGPLSTIDGALQFQGYGAGSYGIYLRGTSTITSNSTSIAPVVLAASVKSGTTSTNVAAGDTAILFRNITNHIANFKGNGDFYTAGGIATGGETAPDVVPGGLCIFSGTTSGFYQTLKNSSIAHGMTDLAETDTFYSMAAVTPGVGGIRSAAYTESAIAYIISGYATTPATSNNSLGVVCINAAKKNGTGVTALAANENILTVLNNSSAPIEITKGNGDKYLDGGLAVGGGTDLLDAYVENTWTPVIADAATGGNLATFTTNRATHTVIGNQCFIEFDLSAIDTTGMTGANILQIRGEPFPGVGISEGTVRLDNITFTGYVTAQQAISASRFTLVESNSGGAITQITVSDLTSGTARIVGKLIYTI